MTASAGIMTSSLFALALILGIERNLYMRTLFVCFGYLIEFTEARGYYNENRGDGLFLLF